LKKNNDEVDENDDNDEDKVLIQRKKYNNFMTMCNIIAVIMIIFALYIIFVYKK
jgi:multisubunit Na+/H+ antiporter MnhB subunit